jgi:hypothetical protein
MYTCCIANPQIFAFVFLVGFFLLLCHVFLFFIVHVPLLESALALVFVLQVLILCLWYFCSRFVSVLPLLRGSLHYILFHSAVCELAIMSRVPSVCLLALAVD